MGYDIKNAVCGLGFRTMVCNSLIGYGCGRETDESLGAYFDSGCLYIMPSILGNTGQAAVMVGLSGYESEKVEGRLIMKVYNKFK